MARPPLPLRGVGTRFQSKFPDGVVHQGVDIGPTGPAGASNSVPGAVDDAVVSPVRGVVKRVFRGADPTSAGTTGFGPAFVVIDAFEDGSEHTLAHLSATDNLPTQGEEVDEGEQVGLVARGVVPSKFHSGVPHVHWEIKSKDGQRLDPISYLANKGVPTSTLPSSTKSSSGWLLLALVVLLASRNAR